MKTNYNEKLILEKINKNLKLRWRWNRTESERRWQGQRDRGKVDRELYRSFGNRWRLFAAELRVFDHWLWRSSSSPPWQ